MRLHRILASLTLLTLLLAGCSGIGDDRASDDSAEVADELPDEMLGGAGSEGADDADTASGAPSGDGAVADVSEVDLDAVPVAAVDRKIIYTGTTSADVEDIGAAVRAARDAAGAEGGYVFAQDLGPQEGRVVLKVPVDRFDAVFDAIVGIGEIADQQIDAEDVTERFVDLESRQATLATSIDRIRGFLAAATNVDEVSRLESELTRREAEHDVIAGQLRVLRDRTAYGTITAQFHLADEASALVDDDDDGPLGFGDGLSAGWGAVTNLSRAVAAGVGFALPFAPVLALLGGALWWWRRSRRPVMPAA